MKKLGSTVAALGLGVVMGAIGILSVGTANAASFGFGGVVTPPASLVTDADAKVRAAKVAVTEATDLVAQVISGLNPVPAPVAVTPPAAPAPVAAPYYSNEESVGGSFATLSGTTTSVADLTTKLNGAKTALGNASDLLQEAIKGLVAAATPPAANNDTFYESSGD